MAPADRQAFRNYFWTAQLTAGLAAALNGFASLEGLWAVAGAIGGFMFVLPLSALAGLYGIRYARRYPDPSKVRTRKSIVYVGLVCMIVVLAASAWFHFSAP